MDRCLKILFFLCIFVEIKSWKGPDFLIIGTQKGGTTSLYKYLIRHPQILGANYKEIHFFDMNYQNGINWYRRQFPIKKTNQELIGEATPLYLYHPLVPSRVFERFPKTKIIILLRNPVDRLISHYFMINKSKNILDLDEVFEKELSAQFALKNLLENKDYEINSLIWDSYLSRGLYFEQIKSWRKFFPSNQILIIFSEDLFKNTCNTVNKVFKFLGLPEYNLKKYYKYLKSSSKKVVKIEDKQRLNQYYKSSNMQLQKYLGIKLPW